jgi:hypothetical protein
MTVEGPATYTFESFIDVVKAAHLRGWRMAVHPKDQAEAVASLERVGEDERWTFPEGPQLELHYDVPRHRIGFFDPESRTLTGLLSKVQNAETGMGRVKKLWLPGRAET